MLDQSFRHASAAIASAAVASAAAAQAKNAAQLNERLARSRDGLHKLQVDLESERARRLAAERDLAERNRELSNERLAASSSLHHLQLAADKEKRLMRELALAQVVQEQLRVQLAEESTEARSQKEEKIRLEERVEANQEEMRSTADQLHSREEELAEVKSELRLAQEELRRKNAALAEAQSGLQRFSAKFAQADAEERTRQSEKNAEDQRNANRHSELVSATAALDAVRGENARLVALVQETAGNMADRWEQAQSMAEEKIEERVQELNKRLAHVAQQQQQLGQILHQGAVQSATMNERLTSKTTELEHLQAEVQQLRHEREESQHAHSDQFHSLQERYQAHLHDLEAAFRERFQTAQTSGAEEQRRMFESTMDAVQREVDRAIQAGVHREPFHPSASSSSASHVFSPASSQNAPGESGSAASRPFSFQPTPLSVASPTSVGGLSSVDVQSSVNPSLQSFYSSSLSLFQSTLLSRLSTAFTAVHKEAERKEYDFQTQISLLRQDLTFHTSQAAERKEAEESLAQRLHQTTQEGEREAKKLRGEVHEKELLLVERGNVIRELKRRYKREQELLVEAKASVAAIKTELAQARQHHVHELETLREQCTSELHSSLTQTESIGQKRLDAEHKLRKRAEEESERYVRQCQQSEAENFLLKQEKVQLTALLQRQLTDLRNAQHTTAEFAGHQRAVSASIQAQAESEARLARMMVVTNPTDAHAAAAARAAYGTSMGLEY